MNTRHFSLKHLVLAAAAALPFAAQADSQTFTFPGFEHLGGPPVPAGQIGKTRAQVRMELEEFQRMPVSADGWLQRGDGQVFVGFPDGAKSKTRAQVRSELAGWSGPVNDDVLYAGITGADEPARAAATATATARRSSGAASVGDTHARLRELVSPSTAYPARAAGPAMLDVPVAAGKPVVHSLSTQQIGERVFGARS